MIRPLTSADLPFARRIIDATELFPSEMIDGMAAAYLDGGATAEFWLAGGQAEPLGIAYCAPERMTEGTWNLYLIAVDPHAQRQGLGAALVRAVEDRVLSLGGRVLLIETSGLDRFAPQRSFYIGAGYREEARIHEFYDAGEDKVVFWKRLG